MFGSFVEAMILGNMASGLAVIVETCGLVDGYITSLSKNVSHWTSQHIVASALYSVSDEDLDTIFCFFVFHEINESPRKMQFPMVEWRVKTHETQSESKNALI